MGTVDWAVFWRWEAGAALAAALVSVFVFTGIAYARKLRDFRKR